MLINKLSNSAISFVDKLKSNRKTIVLCLISTFIWGLVAHAYIFLHSSFSHDSLNEFNADVFGNKWKIRLGRVFVPAYHTLTRGDLALPWLVGLLSLLYVGLAVFLVIKIFAVKSKFITVLVSGIFIANLAFTATAATYITDLDCNMLGMLFSVLAVYLWKKYKWGFLFGIVPVCLSLGIYQSFISVTITLVLIELILQLLNCEKFSTVLIKGFKGIGMLFGGGISYFVSVKIVCHITKIPLMSQGYNSVDSFLFMSPSALFSSAINSYKETAKTFLRATSTYSIRTITVISLALIVVAGAVVLCRLLNKSISVPSKILTLVLIAVMPWGMNVARILSGGMSHDLMHYAVWLTYMFALLIGIWGIKWFANLNQTIKYGQLGITAGLVVVILWGNVQLSNAAYLKKDFEDKAGLSLFTRVLYKIENFDGYVSGETPVVFIGQPYDNISLIDGFEDSYRITGSVYSFVLGAGSRTYYRSYFENILTNPIKIADSKIWYPMLEDKRTEEMPSYPDEGCIKMIDGVMVVRLGDY